MTMPAVHHPANPYGRFPDWRTWRAICGYHRTETPPPPVADPPWRPCPTCWGQGRLYDRGDDGLIATTCPTCIGVREIPST